VSRRARAWWAVREILYALLVIGSVLATHGLVTLVAR
jgi:hypothetical protein